MRITYLLIIITVIAFQQIYANVYTDYDPSFDNSTSIVIEYSITPSISSEDLPAWVHSQGSDHSWVYHLYQQPGFRFEVGYYVWGDSSTYRIKLYGNTSRCNVSAVCVVFPNLKMQAHKTYNIRIEIDNSRLTLYINGQPYKGTAWMQVWYTNRPWDPWRLFNNGNDLPGNFVLMAGYHGIYWNITGWNSDHLGSHPFDEFYIFQPSWNNGIITKTPVSYGVVVISIFIISLLLLLGRGNRWIKRST
jgi:hypothetical protein